MSAVEQLQLEENPVAAQDAAAAGMVQALRAERVALWKARADEWLAARLPGVEFIADDVVRAIGLPDSGVARNNVVGAWTSAKSRQGAIVFTGKFRKSKRVIGHGNLLRVWVVA